MGKIKITVLYQSGNGAEWDSPRDKRQDEADYPVEEYLENCGMVHTVSPGKSFKFVTPYFGDWQYPNGIHCNWTFLGHSTCHPSITCDDVDLRDNPECETEYLEIIDGLGGAQRYCGKMKDVSGIKSSRGGRDLFVTLQTMNGTFDREYAGFLCEVRCNDGKVALKDEFPSKHKEDLRCICGYQNKDDRIVGGENTTMNEFPWMAAIVNKGTRSPRCGAAIINDRWVLTAAHCFVLTKLGADQIDVLFHAHTLDMTLREYHADTALGEIGSIRGSGYNLDIVTDSDEKTLRVEVAEVINHPLFNAKYDYDVALLRLSHKIDFSVANAPIPICLPEPGLYQETFQGTVPTVAGWGLPHQDAGGSTRILQKLEVPIIDAQKCQELMPTTLTQRMMCAGFETGGKDACMGDSGGPLSLKDPKTKQWTQIGVVSWGEGCARKGRPGIYSRLTELVQWVYKNTETAKWCRKK
ncbi:unnamed protein product [Allacma fusca]|uniref:limulus clotting factor C n=1 Tax=Allacma fusca TaxID=39272 RepID=A0A8J2K5W7_9HEXA|nr:unnamed protein product [Allacma fusca]